MVNPYTWLAAGLIFPIHERLKHHSTVRVRRELERTQWWSRMELERLQVQRLRALLRSASMSVPYYRKLFADIGFEVSQIESLADLQRLPFLTKDHIRAHVGELKAKGAGRIARCNTGGSTGEPLIFFIGDERVSHDVAAKWRATRWWDVDIGDPEIVLWGSPIELGAQDRIRAIRDKLLRTRLLPAFEMSPEKLDRFVETIRSFRPRMLFGYPSALAYVAQQADARGVALNSLGIKVAFTTGERLYPEQRERIANAFGCSVANGYGGRDAGFIAHECPHGGMHITAEDIIVEIVDQRGQAVPYGETGEIVVTHLATKEFPFIRYRTGDVAAIDEAPCVCGRGLPLLKEVQGRATDFVTAADGKTVMHGLALIYVIRELTGVQAFKIIQESLERVRVLLVVDERFCSGDEETIRQGFRSRLGAGVTVSVERVDEIEPEKSGKFRYVVSHVPTY